jgi:hypothetical protein
MQDIKRREQKMQEKRRGTPWRDFLKEICSWYSIVFYKNNNKISIYSEARKLDLTLSTKEFEDYVDTLTKQWLDYNWDISFFQNFQKLFNVTKLPALRIGSSCENSNYANNVVWWSKNVYLSHNIITSCENVLYSIVIKEKSINVLNSVMVIDGSENIYFSNGIINGFNIFYSRFINNCSNIWLSTNLTGCQECILSHDLNNQSYCIENVQYEKEIYFTKKKEILKHKEKFFYQYLALGYKGMSIGSDNVTGSFILNSHKVQDGYYVYQIEDGKNLVFTWWNHASKNNFDCFNVWSPSDNFVATLSSYGDNMYCNSTISWSNVYYSYNCIECSYCIGCVGLKNKSFCILNKQYTKEERYELANKIFAQMDAEWILWQFFPWYMNPFYFNDTAAYLIDDSFTKEEVTAEWYLRRDEEIKVDIPAWAEIVKTSELNQYQWRKEIPPTPLSKGGNEPQANGGIKKQRTINPEILKKVIVDEKWNSYRIIKMEYDFLMKHWLPLPEIHWLDRIKLGFKFK